MSAERLFVGDGMRRRARNWTRGLCRGKKIALVSEAGVWRRFGPGVEKSLKAAGFGVTRHLMPTGEAAKSWDAIDELMRSMLAGGLGRDSALVALGGGAVTDAAGFAASIYMRGIPWVSVPTTLLGQLDSGLGGKTGINLAGGKNIAGTFHRPAAVVCDTQTLNSLPARERVSGFGEALKYGLVFDPRLWALMTRRWSDLMAGDPTLIARVVRAGASWKRKTVAQDPHETKGVRELLNFGHTLGHALESTAGLGVLRHGEAVIWGMRAALRLSVKRAGLRRQAAAAADRFLASIPVPLPRQMDSKRLLAAARRDKKNRGGEIRFVLLRALGRGVVLPVSEKEILAVIAELSQ